VARPALDEAPFVLPERHHEFDVLRHAITA
jgi:hypothetical protein